MDECPLDPPSESRRNFLLGTGAIGAACAVPAQAAPDSGAHDAAGSHVRFTLSGEARELAIDPRTTLLDALRERLHLTGTKKGCDRGQCGACTVLVDGRRVNSCLALAVSLDGADVLTIEGVARGDELHPVQAAFIAHDGMQCGFCTPGQLMSCVALLAEG